MPDVSVVIIAKNEERTIGDVLSAVEPIASEYIVVDSGSVDSTVDIARRCGAKVFHQDWLGYAAQKNYALSLASAEWVLSLDADEVATPALVSEIEETLSGPRAGQFQGFRMPRTLYIGERAITHGGFYPDAQLRLFRRGMGQFNDRLVHEAVRVEGRVGMLAHSLKHFAYRNVEEFAQAMERYARLSAEEAARSGYGRWKASSVNEALHPWWTFFYRYVLRAGFLDGPLGLELNLIYSDYVRRKIRYLREMSLA
jgi:glycosyltransferase involved in cell wall biosynthesis